MCVTTGASIFHRFYGHLLGILLGHTITAACALNHIKADPLFQEQHGSRQVY